MKLRKTGFQFYTTRKESEETTMDFRQINFDEMGWFCRSTRSPASVNCYPTRTEILDCFMSILRFYGVDSFSARDIACLFRLMELPNPKTDFPFKPILPTLSQTEKILERRFECNQVSFSGGIYTVTSILDAEDIYADWYPKALKDAYGKDEIRDWVEYAVKHGFICNATLPEKLAMARQALR